MTYAESARCPVCGRRIASDAPLGLCTACTLAAGLAENKHEADSVGASSTGSQPTDRKTFAGDSGSSVRCPQCGRLVQLALSVSLSSVRCDSCGTSFSVADETAASQAASDLGQIGQFQILEKLGTGAFGTVWKARDMRLDRWVSIKIPRHRRLEPTEAEKFLREARAAAQLRHPNIVSVHEVGREADLIYIVRDFVEGVSLADRLTGHRISPREAAGLIAKLARALHHAHEAGVIHRDIKPQNILIDSAGEPHLTDFGLARREAGEVTLTLEGQLLGTPAYMSPEQARGEAHAADRRTDIYSLGAVLFQLLTGELPFRGNARMMVQQVIQDDPPSLRKLNAHTPRDLETITLKCLEKDPGRRYPTAGELADELDRFVNGEPIRARSISQVGRAWRWCRRKPVIAGLTVAVLALLLTVTGVSVAAAWRIAMAREAEQREAYYSNIEAANGMIEEGSTDRALETLWKCPEKYRHWEWGHLLYLCHQDAASFQAHETNVVAVLFSPNIRWVVSQDAAGLARVWDWEAEREVFRFGSYSNLAGSISFDPNGRQLAAAMGTNGVWVWATTNWQRQVILQPRGGEVSTLAYSPNGKQLVTGGADGMVTVWDSASGQQVVQVETTHQPLRRVCLSPGGQYLVAAGERAAWVWEASSGKLIRSFPEPLASHPTNQIFTLFADDTGEHFAIVDIHGQSVLWSKEGLPRPLISIRGTQPTLVRRVFFSPDSHLVMNAGEDNTARLWEVASGAERLAVNERVHQAVFSANDNTMVTLGTESWVSVWDLMERRRIKVLRGHDRMVKSVAVSRDGKLVATGDEGGVVKIWSTSPGRDLGVEDLWQNVAAFSPDGQRIVSGAYCRGWIVRSSRSGRTLLRVHSANEMILGIAFSPDGHRIVTAGSHKTAKVWDVDSGQLLLTLRGHRRQVYCVDWSHDSRRIATGSFDGSARIWDARSGNELQTLHMDHQQSLELTGYSRGVVDVRFDGASSRLITGSTDGKARVWDVKKGVLLRELQAGKGGSWVFVRFHPDGKRAATYADGKQIRLWEISSGRLTAEATTRGSGALGIDISADGRRLIAATSMGLVLGGDSGTIEIWDIGRSPRRTLSLSGRELLMRASFSSDLKSPRIAAPSMDRGLHQWEAFPWNSVAYGEPWGCQPEAEFGTNKTDLAERVRQYARSYWRERLNAERDLAGKDAPYPKVIEIPVDRASFPKRDPGATGCQIDLTDSYTGELNEPFALNFNMDRHDNDLSELPVGLMELGSVRFDIRGVVQLRRATTLGGSWQAAWDSLPARVDGIRVDQPVRRIHLLVGAVAAERDGVEVATLVLHGTDGRIAGLDLVYGRDVREWWWDPAKPDREGSGRGRVVWTGSNPVALRANRSLRLYLTSLENPAPGTGIATIDFVSAMSGSAPFLVALTVE